MENDKGIPLVLGGHSFIQQKGNEPKPTEEERCALVAECLDSGITWFDTTYLPERIALGGALKTLGRREEACIMAWNFFRSFDDGEDVGKASRFWPEHIHQMLEEFQTDYLDCLVVHSVNDERENTQQVEIAREWHRAGLVRRLGTWAPDPQDEETLRPENVYSLMVRPYNIDTPDAGAAFAMGKRLGWETLACSPFKRGWRLDELVAREMKRTNGGSDDQTIRSDVADLMLRYSLFRDHVDRLIVSIRKPAWIRKNIASCLRGKLTEEEEKHLFSLAGDG